MELELWKANWSEPQPLCKRRCKSCSRNLDESRKKAEDRGLKQVTIHEIKEASREAEKLKKSYILSKLNYHQRVIYKILEKEMRMTSG